jgi:hypothetical protein
MALTLITRKISYNNVLKLLELGVPGTNYTELLNHPSSGYYNELAKLLEELHYDGSINYRSIYKFLFDNVWKEQVEHEILNKNTGKFTYTKPSFLDDDNVKRLAYNNRKLKAPGFKKTTRKKATPKKEVPKKKRTRRNNNKITPLIEDPFNENSTPIEPEIRPLEEIKEKHFIFVREKLSDKTFVFYFHFLFFIFI